MCFTAAMTVVEVLRWIRLPVFLDNTEIYVAFGVRSLAHGDPLYRDLSTLPLVVHVYQPLTYVLPALVLRFSDAVGTQILPVARLLNLPILILTLVLVYRITRQLAQDRLVAMIAVITSAYLHAVLFPEVIRLRPENGAIFFTLAALYLALARTRNWWVWAAIAIAIANFFKPTFVALPLAITLRFLVQGDFRAASRFVFLCAGTFGALAGIALLAFGSQYAQQTMLFSVVNPDFPIRKVPVFVLIWIWVFGPALAPLAAGSVRAVCRLGAESLFPLYLPICAALSLAALTKAGADIHYLVELSFALLFGFVAALPRRGRVAAMAATSALAIVFQILGTGSAAVRICAHRHARLACDYSSPLAAAPDAARRTAFTTPGVVVFDEALAFEAGKIVALDWTLLDLLVRSHAVVSSPLFALIASPSTTELVFPRCVNPLLRSLYQAARDAGFAPIAQSGDRVLVKPSLLTTPESENHDRGDAGADRTHAPVPRVLPAGTGSPPAARQPRDGR